MASGALDAICVFSSCRNVTVSGVYWIRLPQYPTDTFQAYCRVDADGTKWLMFQVQVGGVISGGGRGAHEFMEAIDYFGWCSYQELTTVQRRTDTTDFYLNWADYVVNAFVSRESVFTILLKSHHLHVTPLTHHVSRHSLTHSLTYPGLRRALALRRQTMSTATRFGLGSTA